MRNEALRIPSENLKAIACGSGSLRLVLVDLNPMLGKPTVFYNAINRLHVCPTVSRTFSSAKLEVV